MLDENEYDRWIKSARDSMKSGLNDKSSEFYAWACFKFQQAAESACRAYLKGIGLNAFGHSVSSLLQSGDFSEETVKSGKYLDKMYIPTRYTDSWSEGIPSDYYTLDDAEEAYSKAGSVLDEVETKWESLKDEEKKGKK